METVTEVVKNMAGGDGEVTIKRILGEKELNGKCGLYAQVTIQPGSSLGYHEHKNESETYYILSGTAEYNDNGTTRTPENRKHCIKQQFHSNRLTDQPDTGIARQICGFIPSPVLSVHNTSSISSSFCLQLSPPKSASVCPSSTRKSSGVSSSLCTGCSQRYCCSYLCRSEPAVSF